jgi:RimJ/RimL family protein N-acetyltransferase
MVEPSRSALGRCATSGFASKLKPSGGCFESPHGGCCAERVRLGFPPSPNDETIKVGEFFARSIALSIPTKQLAASSRAAMFEHFLELPSEDLRLRFGTMRSPASLAEYVESIDFDRDAVFGVFNDRLELAGVAHVAMLPGDTAELGVSVVPDERRKGIGTALFERANGYARNRRIRTLFTHCLTENRAMMHIAKKAGMQIITDSGEADAWLELAPADAASMAQEWAEERVALFDYALKAHARRIAEVLGADISSERSMDSFVET